MLADTEDAISAYEGVGEHFTVQISRRNNRGMQQHKVLLKEAPELLFHEECKYVLIQTSQEH